MSELLEEMKRIDAAMHTLAAQIIKLPSTAPDRLELDVYSRRIALQSDCMERHFARLSLRAR